MSEIIDKEKVKSIWNSNDFNLDDIFQELNKKVAEYQENMLIQDIINIYNGVFRTYEEYCEMVVRHNELAEKEKNNSILETTYTFRYTPTKTALTERIFDYIKELKRYGKYV